MPLYQRNPARRGCRARPRSDRVRSWTGEAGATRRNRPYLSSLLLRPRIPRGRLMADPCLFARSGQGLHCIVDTGTIGQVLRTGHSIQWLGTVVVADQPAGFTSTHECGRAVLLPCSCHEAVDRGGTGRNDRGDGGTELPLSLQPDAREVLVSQEVSRIRSASLRFPPPPPIFSSSLR